ncbi:MAG: argininosuccinate lyase, partial [Imperialibacter sp.]
LAMTHLMVSNVKVKTDLVAKPEYDYLFTVEKVNELVQAGVPFREAYREVAREIGAGTYKPNRNIKHTHLGSVGSLGNERIKAMMEERVAAFNFGKVHSALDSLKKGQ